jgi:hypothetical protein
MSLVAAIRSMGRIVTLSETMISDEGSRRPMNQIPGRLKSIVMNSALTVSYAGLSLQAIDAIRRLHAMQQLTTDFAIEFLAEASTKLNGEIAFLVCSHESREYPRLIKIEGNQVSEGKDIYWIGNQASANALARVELPAMQDERAGDYFSLEERQFTRRFHHYLGHAADSAVGGMVINCLASPFGHCYQDHYGVYVDRMTIPDSVEPSVRARMNEAGMNGHFKYAVMSTAQRGLALVGTFFEQARIGYIYEPILRDDPEKVEASGQLEFQTNLAARSRIHAELLARRE